MKPDKRVKSEKEFYENFYLRNKINTDIEYALIDKVSFGMNLLGPTEGKIILDLCCGAGITSYHLAKRGGNIISLDISFNALQAARRIAESKGVSSKTEYVVAAAESLPFKDSSLDCIFCNGGLHHTELRLSISEIDIVLKDGGTGVFIETSGLNPLLMFARKYLSGRFGIPRKRTQSEHPLMRRDFKLFANYFKQVEIVKSCHLLSQGSGYLWKSNSLMDRMAQFIDKILLSIPFMRKLGYWLVIKVVR